MNNPQHITQEEWELIEQYLHRKLDDKDKVAFEEQLNTDTSLQEKVQTVQQTMIGIQASSLKLEMNQFHEKLSTTIQPVHSAKIFSITRVLAVAAILAAVAVGIWMFGFNNSSTDNLYASHYKADPGLITSMSQTDDYDFEKAMIDYKSGNYKQAIEVWEKQLALRPSSDTLHYFIGNALLADGQADKAISHLQVVTKNSSSYFNKEAYWYLGMAWLKLGKKKDAISAIEQSNAPQKEELLKKLK